MRTEKFINFSVTPGILPVEQTYFSSLETKLWVPERFHRLFKVNIHRTHPSINQIQTSVNWLGLNSISFYIFCFFMYVPGQQL